MTLTAQLTLKLCAFDSSFDGTFMGIMTVHAAHIQPQIEDAERRPICVTCKRLRMLSTGHLSPQLTLDAQLTLGIGAIDLSFQAHAIANMERKPSTNSIIKMSTL